MGVSRPGQNTDDLKSQLYNLVKQHLEYDVDQRVTRVVTAPTQSSHGDPATEVYYEYVSPVGGGSNIVANMVERAVLSDGVTKVSWDSSWDIGSLP